MCRLAGSDWFLMCWWALYGWSLICLRAGLIGLLYGGGMGSAGL